MKKIMTTFVLCLALILGLFIPAAAEPTDTSSSGLTFTFMQGSTVIEKDQDGKYPIHLLEEGEEPYKFVIDFSSKIIKNNVITEKLPDISAFKGINVNAVSYPEVTDVSMTDGLNELMGTYTIQKQTDGSYLLTMTFDEAYINVHGDFTGQISFGASFSGVDTKPDSLDVTKTGSIVLKQDAQGNSYFDIEFVINATIPAYSNKNQNFVIRDNFDYQQFKWSEAENLILTLSVDNQKYELKEYESAAAEDLYAYKLNDQDNTLTLMIYSNNEWTDNWSLLKNSNLEIRYSLGSEKSAELIQTSSSKSEEVTVHNEAVVNKTPGSCDLEIPKLISKKMTQEPQKGSDPVAGYCLTVNASQIDFSKISEDNFITVTDCMTNQYYLADSMSIKRIDENGSVTTVLPEDYTVEIEYVQNNSNLEITINEAAAYTYEISYEAQVMAPASSTGNASFNYTNQGKLYNIESKQLSQAYYKDWFNAYTYVVNITKKDAYNEEKPVQGATYALYTSEDGKTGKLQAGSGGEYSGYVTTQDDGTAVITVNHSKGNTILSNRLYFLQETKAPDGYELSGEKSWFYFYDNETDKDRLNALCPEATAIKVVQGTNKVDFVVMDYPLPTSVKKIMDINDTTGEKTDWQDSADYDIGDMVPFRLEGNYSGQLKEYTVYNFVFHDEICTGLTIDPATVKVVVKETNQIVDSNLYSVSTENTDGCSLEVEMTDLKDAGWDSYHLETATGFYVYFDAKLNDQAVLGDAGNPNQMRLEYSNNPSDTQSTGYTDWDAVVVYTYWIQINKVDEDNNPLSGADFELYKVKAGDASTTLISKDSSSTDTTFVFKGLDDGTYILKETKAPTDRQRIDSASFQVNAVHLPTWETFHQEDYKTALTNLSGNSMSGSLVIGASDISKGLLTGGAINASLNYSVTILKADAADITKVLAGAWYQCFYADGTPFCDAKVTGNDGKATFENNPEKGQIFKSNTGYYIQEVQAPEGYNIDTTPGKFYFAEKENTELSAQGYQWIQNDVSKNDSSEEAVLNATGDNEEDSNLGYHLLFVDSQKSSAENKVNETKDTTAPTGVTGSSTGVIIAVVLIIVAIAIIAFVLVKKNRNKSEK